MSQPRRRPSKGHPPSGQQQKPASQVPQRQQPLTSQHQRPVSHDGSTDFGLALEENAVQGSTQPATIQPALTQQPGRERRYGSYSNLFATRPDSDSHSEQDAWVRKVFVPYHNSWYPDPVTNQVTHRTAPSPSPHRSQPASRKRGRSSLESTTENGAVSAKRKKRNNGYPDPVATMQLPQTPYFPRNYDPFAVNNSHGFAPVANQTAPMSPVSPMTFQPGCPSGTAEQVQRPNNVTGSNAPFNGFSAPATIPPGYPPGTAEQIQRQRNIAELTPRLNTFHAPPPPSPPPAPLTLLSNRISDRQLVSRRLGICEYHHIGGDANADELTAEWGLPNRRVIGNAAKKITRKFYNETEEGPVWPAAWVKYQYMFLKPMPLRQFAGETNKKNRLSQRAIQYKMAIATCFKAWREEIADTHGFDRAQISDVIRRHRAEEPMMPQNPETRRKLAGDIQTVMQNHPLFTDPNRTYPQAFNAPEYQAAAPQSSNGTTNGTTNANGQNPTQIFEPNFGQVNTQIGNSMSAEDFHLLLHATYGDEEHDQDAEGDHDDDVFPEDDE